MKETLLFNEIRDEESFIQLANRFGKPILQRDGQYIQTLRVFSKEQAPKRSISVSQGNGMFPFHTDTAHWIYPARLVLLRGLEGDLRRSTYVRPFSEMLEGIDISSINHSAWLCDAGTRKFYTTLSFSFGDMRGCRFDEHCMRPANTAARATYELLIKRSLVLTGFQIKWSPNLVAIIPNWTHMHARGIAPENEGQRLIQRIYVY